MDIILGEHLALCDSDGVQLKVMALYLPVKEVQVCPKVCVCVYVCMRACARAFILYNSVSLYLVFMRLCTNVRLPYL